MKQKNNAEIQTTVYPPYRFHFCRAVHMCVSRKWSNLDAHIVWFHICIQNFNLFVL